MKTIKNYLFLLVFLLGSFYYTNRSIEIMRNQDPIMKQIDQNSEKYQINPVNAEIIDNTIIPGVTGHMVDREKSYHQMKQYGNYNETMTVLKEIKPEVSKDLYYNKYIETGNPNERRIALVFPILEGKTFETLLTLLKKENVNATIFIDGNDLDENISLLKKYDDHEYELLSFQKKYNASYLKTAESYLENITKQKTEYCYTEKENKELLNYCSKNKHHVIKPKIILNNNLTYHLKKTITNGSVIAIHVTEANIKEISPMIQYIKSKGYRFESLKNLLKE